MLNLLRVMSGFLRWRSCRRPLAIAVFIAMCAFLVVVNALCAAVYAAEHNSPLVYRSASSILALSPENSRRGDPTVLLGVVTQSMDLGFIVQDQTAGIWVYWNHSEDLAAGDRVEVRGVVNPGLFSPAVKAESVQKLGRSPLPEPKTVTFQQLSTGDEDDQYVSVTGVVRSMGIRSGASSSQNVWLKIAMADGLVDATFSAGNAVEAQKLIDAVVRIKAAAMCTKNQNRQITAVTLAAGSMSNLTVVRAPPQDLFAQPLVRIGQLMQYKSGTNYYQRVRLAGIVTYYKPGERLILEDAGNALLVMTTQVSNIQLGDRVEALGFPSPEDSGPILQDAVIRYIAHGQPLQPTPVKLADISSGSSRYDLVSTEGHLLRRVDEPSRVVLLVQNEANLLLAELSQPVDSNALKMLKEGSTIRVSGISMLEVEGTWNYGIPSASVVRCKLLLRSPRDIQIIQPPSWWTVLHVMYLAAILGILMLALLALVVYNRMERWKLQAVLDERERLAHEIHDTLAQSFAGIGFQLQAIRKAIPVDTPLLRQQVDLARDLVRHSHKEARRSVEPLHSESHEGVDLLSSLRTCAFKMVEGGSVKVMTASSGTPRLLPPHIAIALLRIGQEAIANAVRHADPTNLEIYVAYERNMVLLTVRDDGCGFVKSGDLLGFGLRGMRKRAAALSAKLEIVSQPRKGTSVEVSAPLPPDFLAARLVKHIWKYLSERRPHAEAK